MRQLLRGGANRADRGAAKTVDRFAEADVLSEHDKLQHVAADAASEAPPGLGGGKDMQVRTTTVGVKRTPSDERASLSFELDTVPSDNIFNAVGIFQRSNVNPRWPVPVELEAPYRGYAGRREQVGRQGIQPSRRLTRLDRARHVLARGSMRRITALAFASCATYSSRNSPSSARHLAARVGVGRIPLQGPAGKRLAIRGPCSGEWCTAGRLRLRR